MAVPATSLCSCVPLRLRQTWATSFSACAALDSPCLPPPWSCQPHRFSFADLRLRYDLHRCRPALSEWPSFAHSDNTRAGFFPSAFSRGTNALFYLQQIDLSFQHGQYLLNTITYGRGLENLLLFVEL